MTTTKTPPIYGDNLPITPYQIKAIMANCVYQVDTKDEWVQWVTADVARTSLKSITQEEATKIILAQTGGKLINETKENWGAFNKNNKQHTYVLALLRNAQITVKNAKYGEVADIDWLARFLQSARSPVKKPLMKMNPLEASKTITALSGVVVWKHSI